jgi:hypothetical protein
LNKRETEVIAWCLIWAPEGEGYLLLKSGRKKGKLMEGLCLVWVILSVTLLWGIST